MVAAAASSNGILMRNGINNFRIVRSKLNRESMRSWIFSRKSAGALTGSIACNSSTISVNEARSSLQVLQVEMWFSTAARSFASKVPSIYSDKRS